MRGGGSATFSCFISQLVTDNTYVCLSTPARFWIVFLNNMMTAVRTFSNFETVYYTQKQYVQGSSNYQMYLHTMCIYNIGGVVHVPAESLQQPWPLELRPPLRLALLGRLLQLAQASVVWDGETTRFTVVENACWAIAHQGFVVMTHVFLAHSLNFKKLRIINILLNLHVPLY